MEAFKIRKEDIDVQIAGISTNAYATSSPHPSTPPLPEGEEPTVLATELLVIRVDNIQASLEGIKWSFGQTYFPHLKGAGEANATIENAHLLLKFELRKKPAVSSPSSNFQDAAEFEPVLCLDDRQCSIEAVSLQLKGDSLSWLYNMMASLFK